MEHFTGLLPVPINSPMHRSLESSDMESKLIARKYAHVRLLQGGHRHLEHELNKELNQK